MVGLISDTQLGIMKSELKNERAVSSQTAAQKQVKLWYDSELTYQKRVADNLLERSWA